MSLGVKGLLTCGSVNEYEHEKHIQTFTIPQNSAEIQSKSPRALGLCGNS
jgi:hypothetical protein